MGVYPNHGVEYWFEVDNNFDNIELKKIVEEIKQLTNYNVYVTPMNDICVLSTAKTDDRLIKSNYYKERKDDWFNHRTLCEHWREFIDEQLPKEHIICEGWFDVNTIGYS